ncbi:hypothetical protein TNCV_2285481 [Trichonephila clavipes]|nr:hypothetical protein TNCV_2285481 [Trichonephila clavipes]
MPDKSQVCRCESSGDIMMTLNVWEDNGFQHLRDVALAIQCICNAYKRVAAVKSNTTRNHDTGCRTNVAMHNATVRQLLPMVSPNSNLTIGTLKAEAGFVSKHNVIPFRCLGPPFIAPLEAQTPVVSSQG